MLPGRGRFTVALLAASLLALGLSACGGGGATTTVTERQTTTFFMPATGAGNGMGGGMATTPTPPTGSGGGSSRLDFQMGEFYFKPAQATIASGSVKVTVDNVGAAPHEWVVAKTDLDPANLPTAANGDVDEEQLDSPGEIPDVGAGTQASTTVDLKPGKYVFFCNIPGHYAAGMYGALDVTGG